MKDPAKLRTVLSMENRRPLLESQDFLNLLREKGEIELLKYLEEAVANLPAEPLEKGG